MDFWLCLCPFHLPFLTFSCVFLQWASTSMPLLSPRCVGCFVPPGTASSLTDTRAKLVLQVVMTNKAMTIAESRILYVRVHRTFSLNNTIIKQCYYYSLAESVLLLLKSSVLLCVYRREWTGVRPAGHGAFSLPDSAAVCVVLSLCRDPVPAASVLNLCPAGAQPFLPLRWQRSLPQRGVSIDKRSHTITSIIMFSRGWKNVEMFFFVMNIHLHKWSRNHTILSTQVLQYHDFGNLLMLLAF